MWTEQSALRIQSIFSFVSSLVQPFFCKDGGNRGNLWFYTRSKYSWNSAYLCRKMLNSLDIQWLLSLLLRTQEFPPASLLSIILIQFFFPTLKQDKKQKHRKARWKHYSNPENGAHFIVFQHISPRDLRDWKSDDICITPLWHILVTFCQIQSSLEAILKVIWPGSVKIWFSATATLRSLDLTWSHWCL